MARKLESFRACSLCGALLPDDSKYLKIHDQYHFESGMNDNEEAGDVY